MRKLFILLILAVALMGLFAAHAAAVDFSGMTDAEIQQLIDDATKELERRENERLEAEAQDGIDEKTIFHSAGVVIQWNGFADTDTSGISFNPALYMENNSDETVTITPSGFYINGFLMNVSNSGAITLDPHTKLQLSTKYSWLLSAEDLISVYGCRYIDTFDVTLTIKDGNKNVLAENYRVHIDSHIDIFWLMRNNSYFKKQYPTGYEVKPLNLDEMQTLYEGFGVLLKWNGLQDTHTSGISFNPNIYIENSSEKSISVDPSRFYINGYLMNVSNSGAITLEPHTKLLLSTKYSWLLSAEDLVSVYGCSSIDTFDVTLTIKDEDKNYLAENYKIHVDTCIDIFALMGDNSYFTKKYPLGYQVTPLNLREMQTLFEKDGVILKWDGLMDTHTSGISFNPSIYMENNSDVTISVSPSKFYINGYLMNVSNSGAITLEPHTRLMLSTKNSWLLSAEDLISVYGCRYVDTFEVILTIKDESKHYLAENRKIHVDAHIDIFDLMGDNSYFTKKYPLDYQVTPLNLDEMPTLFEMDGVLLKWNGFLDTHTSGISFNPNIYMENDSDVTVTISPSKFHINSYLMNVSNSGAITLEPHTKIMLGTKYSWLLSAKDLIDEYKCSCIDTFDVTITVKNENKKTLAEDHKIHIDTHVDLYDLMSENSYFTKKYPREES